MQSDQNVILKEQYNQEVRLMSYLRMDSKETQATGATQADLTAPSKCQSHGTHVGGWESDIFHQVHKATAR